MAYFQERFSVYATTRRFFVDVLDAQGPSDPNVLEEFIEATAHAEFIFGEDVTDLWNRIIRAARLMLGSIALSGGVGTTDFLPCRMFVEQFLRDADEADATDPTTWRQKLEQMQQELNRVFEPYLRLHHSRNWLIRLSEWVDSRPDVLAAGRYSNAR